MKYCKYCGAQQDDDAIFCSECAKRIIPKETTSKKETALTEEKLRTGEFRVMSTKEYEIDGTIYTVQNIVPANCTDEMFKDWAAKKVERLILNDVESAIQNEEISQASGHKK